MAEATSDPGDPGEQDVEQFDTRHRHLRAFGHRLERSTATVDGDAMVRWRLVLGRPARPAERPDPDPIDLIGPRDGTVPCVVTTLFAGVTAGMELAPVVSDDDRAAHDLEAVRLGGGAVPVDATLDELVRSAAVRAARSVIGLDPHLRLDAMPDDVHDARVAARRLRSELHSLEHVLRVGRTERLRRELAWYGAALGEVRDLDVMLEQVDGIVAVDPDGARLLRIRVRNQRRVGALVMRNAIASMRARELYDELVALVEDPWFAKGVDPRRRARRAALEAVRTADRRIAHAVRSIGDPPDAVALHEVRKRAKACRYVCELVSGQLGSERLAAAMKALQTTLGSLQDTTMVEAWAARVHRPPLEPAAAAALAEVADRLDVQRHAAIEVWPSRWVRAQADALRPWID